MVSQWRAALPDPSILGLTWCGNRAELLKHRHDIQVMMQLLDGVALEGKPHRCQDGDPPQPTPEPEPLPPPSFNACQPDPNPAAAPNYPVQIVMVDKGREESR